VSKTDLALHYVRGFLALEVFYDRQTEGDGGAHGLARDDVSADDGLGFFVEIGAL